MPRISLPIEQMKSSYTVVVIGSGYGGAIAASRMARAGKQVCLLERGKEIQPGEYPNTLDAAALEMQTDTPEAHLGPATGLFDFRVNADLNVVLGCGLGGTSLINANVGLRAEPRVFDDAAWPAAFRNDAKSIEDSYARAERVLQPQPVPDSFGPVPKTDAHHASGDYLHAKWYRTPLYVTFQDPAGGLNPFGVPQSACIGCGDCVSGCNFHAKNTTLMNYLPDAANFGAEIFTEVSVRYVARSGDAWRIYYRPIGVGREQFGAPDLFVTADVVILGAGTLGSTEILLRSAQNGLALSSKLGEHFTGNGDVLGFAYNTDTNINGVGFGDHAPQNRDKVGPCITSVIDLRGQPDLNQGMVIEDGSVPGAVGTLLPAGLEAAATLGGNLPRGLHEVIQEKTRELESLVGGPYTGAIRNTQTYLVMTHDGAAGRMLLEDDRLRISWPSVGTEPIFAKANDNLKQAAAALGGVFAPNPTWHSLQQKALVSVHPLGGCIMGENAGQGVVNHKGQVFAGGQGDAVYEGLYVDDGAVIPRSLGVNPSLTISAIAERTCALIAQDRGWKIDYEAPSRPKAMAASPVGIEFTETMKGFWKQGVADFDIGETDGKAAGNNFQFTLTIRGDDVNLMLAEPGHEARMAGTVTAPGLSAKPLTVTDGIFNLFVVNPDEVETRNMRYRMTLVSEEGKHWYFDGFKVIHQGPVTDIWHDTSTLYITLSADGSSGPVIGKGVLHIEPADFAKQMTTMKLTNAPQPTTVGVPAPLVKFGEFFAGTLFQTYGGVFARASALNPDAPTRKRRALRAGAPVVYPFRAKDGVALRLTRYQGGSKGPVILSHGLGVSSLIFSLDTIETNMLEYLFAHGYDVWLLDYRASIELPAAELQASGDDVALYDYPAAVDMVREVTGAPDVQMVVHCWGSTTFFMSMLAGLQGVRSAVCSQIATDIVAPIATHIKTGLHVPSFLNALGIPSLTADASTQEGLLEKVFDGALRLYPVAMKERCENLVCHRISFLYAPLYDHAQLNDQTHSTLYETFGVANIKSFQHLALLTNKGHLVNFAGEEVYLPHIQRLAIPITFIHGADNECFEPESTRLTYERLRQANGKDLYDRHVIPGYGHIDCIFGKNAARDVFPVVLNALDTAKPRTAQVSGVTGA
ncbi:MAG TPA: alpha/beta fold hydrolase [Bryobacteraceae bacterium]|nr:alpha/beta fold hydrolase [Bryobacteraceae bacterium]